MKKKDSRNITIITPFYPIKHRSDLFEDTKAVYYLLKGFAKHNNVLIIHLFNHDFLQTWKQITKVVPIKSNYTEYLHKDDYGNPVLFFENLFLFPKTIKTLSYFSNKYVNLVHKYCESVKYSPEVGVVHFPTYYVDFIRKIRVFPKKIAVIHSFDIKNIKKRASVVFWKNYFKGFNAIGFRSYRIKKEFEEHIGIHKKTFMCLSGIPEKYIYSDINYLGYNNSDTIRIMYAGRLDENKNVIRTIYALNRLDPSLRYKFTIIGDGEKRKHIETVIKDLGLCDKIELKGKLSRDETFRHMQNSDIFIMVSKKETLGLVYLEAMAAGCIVIGTRGQGIDGIITDGVNGFLTDSNNEEYICQTIHRAMTLNYEEQKKMIESAKNTVKSLSDINVSNEYFYNICSVIKGEDRVNEKII